MANVQYFNLCFDILDAKEKQVTTRSLASHPSDHNSAERETGLKPFAPQSSSSANRRDVNEGTGVPSDADEPRSAVKQRGSYAPTLPGGSRLLSSYSSISAADPEQSPS